MSESTSPTTHVVTRLLGDLQAGDESAAERLVPLIYSELHGIAERQMRNEREGHTLQPTALVHEAFLKLVDQRAGWQNRAQFFGVAAQVMRRILVDHARRRRAQKRGGGEVQVTLDDVAADVGSPASLDLVLLDDALNKLAALDARQAKVVELRFFAGLSVEEAAEALGTSPATVKRDWQFAKAWLKRELG
ncbi:MAG: sigma-70 family RNA polymerase sigma factor [Gemmatimonadales bacterium]